MAYHDLSALLDGSSSSRSYFLSLPVKMQLQLHQREALIHTAEDLHRLVLLLSRQPDHWGGSSPF